MGLLVAMPLLVIAAAERAGGKSQAVGSGNLQRAELGQAGRKLVLTIRTEIPVPLARLQRTPPAGKGRYLCLVLERDGGRGQRRLCLGGRRRTLRALGLELLNAAGEVVAKRTVPARVKRPREQKAMVSFTPEDAGLTPGRYDWRVVEAYTGCTGRRSEECRGAFPANSSHEFRLRPVRAVGCTGAAAKAVRSGPRDKRRVALTFDDGPSSQTPDFLSLLRRKRVHATFFVVGQEIPGRADTMRAILAGGHEIGNHTTHHGFYPGYADMQATNRLIEGATRFQPCLFRPPGGATNGAVVAAAAEAGMTTLLWDVDPGDWGNPGSGAVYSRVVGAVRPGSIVVMHDGGGNRGGTLAALSSIIDTLRARGYGFRTVSQLLGQRLVYKPYG